MKRLFHRPIAHRGLHSAAAGIIENSASAFEAAIAAGYDIECDVHLSSDDVPFIFHDDTLERLTKAQGVSGDLPISSVKALALNGSATGDVPQTLEEFLEQVGGRTGLQIELKQQPTRDRDARLARAVARIIEGYRGQLTIESLDPHLITLLRREGVKAPLGIVTYAYPVPNWDREDLTDLQKWTLRHLLHWPWSRFDFISCHDGALTLPAIRLCRALGFEVTTWTIKSKRAARAALKRADQIVFERYRPPSG